MALLTFFGRYGPNIPSGNVHDQELKPPKDVGAISSRSPGVYLTSPNTYRAGQAQGSIGDSALINPQEEKPLFGTIDLFRQIWPKHSFW